jgi:hypothetical protein
LLALFIGILMDVITALPSIHPLAKRCTAQNHLPKCERFQRNESLLRREKCARLWHDVTRPEKVRRLNVTAKRTAAIVDSLWALTNTLVPPSYAAYIPPPFCLCVCLCHNLPINYSRSFLVHWRRRRWDRERERNRAIHTILGLQLGGNRDRSDRTTRKSPCQFCVSRSPSQPHRSCTV